MLHRYGSFPSPLSRFLDLHRLEEQIAAAETERAVGAPGGGSASPTDSACEDGRYTSPSETSPAAKSFTIAAILGLKGDDGEVAVTAERAAAALMPGVAGLHLPVRHPGTAAGHAFSVSSSATCTIKQQQQQTARGYKNFSSGVVVGKKGGCKSKRVRTIFTPEQLERLEAEFERQQYMVGPERLYLAHTLQLTEAQVKVWFQNRRIKWRKHHLELTHRRLAALEQQQQQQQQRHQQQRSVLGESRVDAQDTDSSSNDNT